MGDYCNAAQAFLIRRSSPPGEGMLLARPGRNPLNAGAMTLIYRSFDQAGLDAAYNNRLAVPHFETTYIQRWVADSAKARAEVPAKLDLAYGPSPRQRLDVFTPGGPAPAGGRPALLYFHGGYWQGGDKDIYSFPAPKVTATGVLYIAATYDLCPTVSMT